MVVALGPGKFYGSSLPRPRFYTDVKLNDHRVDPPVHVLDPLMSWAEEAHWSMGGLSFQRHRLQGRIEGNVKRLRAQREKFLKIRKETATTTTDQTKGSAGKNKTPSPPPAPIATKRRRFMALIDEDDDENDMGNRESESGKEEKIGGGVGVRRRFARKLGDDFDRVASDSGLGKSRGSPVKSSGDGSETVARRTRSRRSEKEDDNVVTEVEEVNRSNSKGKKLKKGNGKAERVGENGASTPASGTRASPRLARRGST